MKQPLPLLFVAVLATATPASAQSLFFDTNGNGQCDSGDYLPFGDGTADVWLDTNHASDGTIATCATGEDLSIAGYDVVLDASVYGPGSITIQGWTNAVSQFTREVGTALEGQFLWAGYQSEGATTYLPPGKYKLGTVSFSASGGGCNGIYILSGAVIAGTSHYTDFWSQCPGSGGDNYLTLGADFTDVCQLAGICDAVQPSTWGKIKEIYRNR